jgi:hypothetical protein
MWDSRNNIVMRMNEEFDCKVTYVYIWLRLTKLMWCRMGLESGLWEHSNQTSVFIKAERFLVLNIKLCYELTA